MSAFARSVVTVVLALASAPACGSKSTDPAPFITNSGPTCRPPTCGSSAPRGAFAVETVPALEGGTCASPVAALSLPAGDPALRAVIACGGNQVRCGDADYRVGDGDRDLVTCTTSGTDTVHVRAHASSGGASVDVVGVTSAAGAGVTVTVTDSAGKTLLDRARCTAVTHFAVAGTIYADFTCGASDGGAQGGAACVVRGTFVFEGCGSG
jgi:hypothetical protein